MFLGKTVLISKWKHLFSFTQIGLPLFKRHNFNRRKPVEFISNAIKIKAWNNFNERERENGIEKDTEVWRIWVQFVNLGELLTSESQIFIICEGGNWTQHLLSLFLVIRFNNSMKMVELFVIQISNSDGASDRDSGRDKELVEWQCPHVESALVFH